MTSRNMEAFRMKNDPLQRIRNIIASGPISEARQSEVDPQQARLIAEDLGQDEIVSLFQERAQSSGATVHRAKDRDHLKRVIEEIVADCGSLALFGSNQIRERLGYDIRELMPASCPVIDAANLDRDRLFEIEAALTPADLGVAETGSILLSTQDHGARLASLVCEVHIALIWHDQIRADLLDWSAHLTRGDLPQGRLSAGLTLISGPSKTADIEIKLVKGVHGPARVHWIVVEK